MFANSHHVQKQRSATRAVIIVVEAAAPARNRKRLTREARKTNVEFGHVICVNFRYVARNFFDGKVGKICRVSFSGVFVNFADENSFDVGTKSALKAQSNSADTSKKFNHCVFQR